MLAGLFVRVRGHTRAAFAVSALVVLALVSAFIALPGSKASGQAAHETNCKDKGSASGLGQLCGLLPRDHLTEESAIQVNLNNETVRLPLYPGTAYAGTPQAEQVWYLLLDASDAGLAHDLGVNYAPKLANIAISDPAAV